jgi:hypothetical protein
MLKTVWEAGPSTLERGPRPSATRPIGSITAGFPGRPQEISTVPFWQRGSQQGRIRAPKTKGPIWDDPGVSIVEHVAGVDDFEMAEAAYRAAVARWPAARITLRQARAKWPARTH